MGTALEKRIKKLEATAAGVSHAADLSLADLWDNDAAERLYDVLLPKGEGMTAEERREAGRLIAARRAWGVVHYGEDEDDYDYTKPSPCDRSVASAEAKIRGTKAAVDSLIAELRENPAEADNIITRYEGKLSRGQIEVAAYDALPSPDLWRRLVESRPSSRAERLAVAEYEARGCGYNPQGSWRCQEIERREILVILNPRKEHQNEASTAASEALHSWAPWASQGSRDN